MDLRRGRGKERVFGERKVDSISGSSSRTDNNKEVLVDNYANGREGVQGFKFEQSGSAKESEFDEKYSRNSRFPIENWIPGNDLDMNSGRPASVNSSAGDIYAQLKNFAGSVRSRGSIDQWGVERDRFEGFYGSPSLGAECGRIPASAYSDEGPSNYKQDSFDGYGEQKYMGDLSEVEDLEQDRAEILRKLDELKEKLSRSYDVADKPRERVPMERSRTPPDPYGDRLTYNLSMQPYAADKQMPRPRYFNYSNGASPFMDHHNMDMQNFYPPQGHPLNVIPEYEDPSQPQMRRPPHHPLQYQRPQPHEYFMEQHMDFNPNPPASYLHENVSHSPACSCLGCYNQNWVVPPQVPLTDFGNRRVPRAPVNSNSYHHVNPATFVPHDYNPRYANPPPLHTRWQSDLDSDNDGYGDRHPRRGMAVNRHGRIFHPVAGGAPFIACFSCFELLKLPRKLNKTNKNQSKLRCGSCSTVISLEIKNKKIITSALKESNQLSSNVDQSSNEVVKGSILSSHSSPNAGGTYYCCEVDQSANEAVKGSVLSSHSSPNADDNNYYREVDQSSNEAVKGSVLSSHSSPSDTKSCREVDQSSNEAVKGSVLSSHSSPNDTKSCHEVDQSSNGVLDKSGNNLQCIDTKESSLADDQKLNFDKSENRQGLTSSSSVSSKEEEVISDSVIAHRDVSDSAELPTKDSFSPARPGSPLWEQSNDNPSKRAVSRDEKGNKSKHMDQGKAIFSRITSRQNSVKDRSVETEVDTSFNEYLNTNISQDSAEGTKEEDRHKVGKGSDSFLVGLFKKSLKSSQVVERRRPSVLINGQPIPDHVVKKAEKLAGPIQPGDYWYDFRAGFWGVMGQTCLGIIPPFIEEFYYPMPTNCAAGNTGVYVNGRELHQRDLDILASRGLPTTRDKFYTVEISGRVTDEDSGKQLDSLGKLAPTIEKAKHGFGMKVPRMVA